MKKSVHALPKYSVCRDRFLELAVGRGFKHTQVMCRGSDPFGESLSIDFAFKPGRGPWGLIHISGTHGVEGYLGSEIQCEVIRGNLVAEDVPVLFVHALNPFGMAWYRRCNSANVDLNRNGVSTYDVPTGDTIRRIAHLLSARSSAEFFLNLPMAMLTAQRIGMRRATSEIARGQYENSTGLFYGGKSLQFELQVLMNQIQSHFGEQKRLAIIDVHTGLGANASELLLLEGKSELGEEQFFSSAFHTSLSNIQKDDSLYPANGTVACLLHRELAKFAPFHVTQEFGTRSSLEILRLLVTENSHYLSKGSFCPRVARRTLSGFYPDSQAWRTACVRTGVTRFQQLLTYLVSKSPRLEAPTMV